MASLIGRNLGNKYKIRSLLGQGGMATVYLGYQEALERQVAIKVLPPHPGLNTMFIERFQLEAKTVARLQHPHILQLYDYGVEDDILYLVTPFVGGGALEEVMRDGKVDSRYTEHVLREIAGALDYAHRQGVIHRDIKPGNILLDDEGHALLADFGIVKITGDGGNLTGTGVVGTPAYMSPEQCQGMPLNAPADIYSLGVVVYEMLSGKQPYEAETPVNVMMKHVYDPPPNIMTVNPDLPPGLEHVMLRVLAKNPDERYQTATAFAEDVSAALQGKPISASTPPPAAKAAEISSASQPPTPTPSYISAIPPQTYAGTQTAPNGTLPQNPTIIVQDSGSTKVLIIGFAILALLIVGGFAALLVLTNRPEPFNNEPPDGPGFLETRDIFEPPADQTLTAEGGVATQQAALPTPAPTTSSKGRVTFGLVNEVGDSVNVRLQRVGLPDQGKVYVAWLVNPREDSVLNIGRIAIDASGEGAVSYIAPENTFLPAAYNTVNITVENAADEAAAAPKGEVVFSGSIPTALGDALNALFVASPDGFNERGLLISAGVEARFGEQHAGLASGARNVVGMRMHAEHTLQILGGGEEDYDGNGRVNNPGTGIGLYTYLDRIETLLSEIEAIPDISSNALGEADNVRLCLDNVRIWTDRVVELEHEIVAAQRTGFVANQLAASTLVAAQLINGHDQNENGVVESFEGECGLFQAGASALLIASIDINEPE